MSIVVSRATEFQQRGATRAAGCAATVFNARERGMSGGIESRYGPVPPVWSRASCQATVQRHNFRQNSPVRGSSDTIFAAATGGSSAAITVFKLSGTLTRDILLTLCGALPEAQRASLRALRDKKGELIDRGLTLWFPGPRSYTGEDCAELHVHGGRAVANAIGDTLASLGARPAEPGEFTRRGVLYGKFDLIEAEAIADLVMSETDTQRRQAVRQLEGDLGSIYRAWAERLRDQLARAEASIDFAEEDSTASAGCDLGSVAELLDEITRHLADSDRGQRLRDGLVFAIVGAPNVGKSSVMNRLAGRDVSIVADSAGTTRDVIEARVVFGDVPVTLLDTAGLRATSDPVEAEGARRALAKAHSADLVVHLQDASGTQPAATVSAGELVIANKIDLNPAPTWASLAVSALSGQGFPALHSALDAAARNLTQASGPAPLTQVRHRAALSRAADHLTAARQLVDQPELLAEELRCALHAIGVVTGHVSVEEVLDSVFQRFCIGK